MVQAETLLQDWMGVFRDIDKPKLQHDHRTYSPHEDQLRLLYFLVKGQFIFLFFQNIPPYLFIIRFLVN
jgi:hypothetical protein